MSERLTDAELTFLSEWHRCDEDGMEYYHRAIAELRELRRMDAENAALVTALEDMYALTANPWCHIPDGWYHVISNAAVVLDRVRSTE